MKSRAILEGFPLNLLLPPNVDGGLTVLLLDPQYGELQIQAVPHGTRKLIIVLPPSYKTIDLEKPYTRHPNESLIIASLEELDVR